MGAARASTTGHWGVAFSAMNEAQTACAIGRGTMGFAFPRASFGTTPFPSLFLTSFTSHQTPFTHPAGVTLHSMLRTIAPRRLPSKADSPWRLRLCFRLRRRQQPQPEAPSWALCRRRISHTTCPSAASETAWMPARPLYEELSTNRARGVYAALSGPLSSRRGAIRRF
jgi:hypothetical protein